MDTELRDLERRFSSGDRSVTDILYRARLRAGLGWFGETLFEGYPTPLPVSQNVYLWRKDTFQTQLVRVPGGETECDECRRDLRSNIKPCPFCKSSGVRKVDPFFVGRFPVMRGEGSTAGEALTPRTQVTIDQAREFCAKVGLRLMTVFEWEWVVFGGNKQKCEHCNGAGRVVADVNSGFELCVPCHTWPNGFRRPYPWGDEAPTKAHCVWPDTNAKPVVTADGLPARELGRSWCEVHDLTGNVSQLVDIPFPRHTALDFAIVGGSFRSPRVMDPHFDIAFGGRRPMDHVGFRVALTCPENTIQGIRRTQ